MKPQLLFIRIAIIIALLSSPFWAANLQAQEDSRDLYIEITKIKKMDDDFMDMENELVKPFVQERIKQGSQLAHVVFRISYPYSDNNEYDYVILDAYSDFDHLNLGRKKMGEIAYATFPNADLNEMIGRFESAANSAGSDVFMLRDEAFPGPGSSKDVEPGYIVANHMTVPSGKGAEYVNMESEIFKPIQQARGKAGTMLEWSLFQRVMPYGTDFPTNYITFDIYENWSDIEGGDFSKMFAEVHPDKDMDKVWEKMEGLRELTRAEVWRPVLMVTDPSPEVTYEMVKEGSGDNPLKGQEILFEGTMYDMEGKELFKTADLGFDWYGVVGENMYDRFFDRGIMQMKKGGEMKMSLPVDAQDEQTLATSGGQDVVMHIKLVDIAEPKPDGVSMLKETMMREGLASARKQYDALQANNPEGYTFREGAMNTAGYQLMSAGHLEEAVYIFSVNQENYPKSWNAYDSLGDGYMATGNKAKAKECYQNALNINPEFTAAKNKLDKL